MGKNLRFGPSEFQFHFHYQDIAEFLPIGKPFNSKIAAHVTQHTVLTVLTTQDSNGTGIIYSIVVTFNYL